MSVATLVLAFSLLLMIAAFALLLVGREQTRRQRLDARRGSLVRIEADALFAGAPVLTGKEERSGWRGQATRLFGYEVGKSDQYPLPWWIAGLVALAMSRAVVWLCQNVVGGVAYVAWLPTAFLMLRSYFAWAGRRRRDTLFKQFPEALGMVVRAVRVGVPMQEAVRAVAREIAAPSAPIFVRVSDEMAIGVSLEDALRGPAIETGLPEYRFFATAVALQAQTGGALSGTLENLADTIRKRVAARARGKALAAEARASALVLAILPVFAAGAMMLFSPAYMAQLFATATGRKILTFAIMAETLGILAMRMLIVRALT